VAGCCFIKFSFLILSSFYIKAWIETIRKEVTQQSFTLLHINLISKEKRMTSINPQITTISVGTRSLRDITIYPLSLADQGKLTKILSGVFQSVMGALSAMGDESEELEDLKGTDKITETIESVAKQLSNINIVETIVGLIQENLEIVLGLMVDPHEKITMEELTNEQFYNLVEIIYEVNYEGGSKNFPALWKRALGKRMEEKDPKKKVKGKASRLKKPSPESADGTTTG
jgi:hypothetical protein